LRSVRRENPQAAGATRCSRAFCAPLPWLGNGSYPEIICGYRQHARLETVRWAEVKASLTCFVAWRVKISSFTAYPLTGDPLVDSPADMHCAAASILHNAIDMVLLKIKNTILVVAALAIPAIRTLTYHILYGRFDY
jgi:hypothetical protein